MPFRVLNFESRIAALLSDEERDLRLSVINGKGGEVERSTAMATQQRLTYGLSRSPTLAARQKTLVTLEVVSNTVGRWNTKSEGGGRRGCRWSQKREKRKAMGSVLGAEGTVMMMP